MEMQNRIEYCMNAITPLKTIIIPSHKVWCEPWITKGLSKSMNKYVQLYKQSIQVNALTSIEHKYKSYRNTLTKIKQKARMDYYTNRCIHLKIKHEEIVAIN